VTGGEVIGVLDAALAGLRLALKALSRLDFVSVCNREHH
jgi:hypothetical protein